MDGMELGLVQDPGPLSVGQLLGGVDGLESCGSCDLDGRGGVNPARGIGPAAGGLWGSDGDGSGVSQGGILLVSGMYWGCTYCDLKHGQGWILLRPGGDHQGNDPLLIHYPWGPAIIVFYCGCVQARRPRGVFGGYAYTDSPSEGESSVKPAGALPSALLISPGLPSSCLLAPRNLFGTPHQAASAGQAQRHVDDALLVDAIPPLHFVGEQEQQMVSQRTKYWDGVALEGATSDRRPTGAAKV